MGNKSRPAQVLGLSDEIHRRPDFLGIHVQLIIIKRLQLSNGASQRPSVSYCLHDVASACFTLGSNHGCAFNNTPESLTKVSAPTDERYLEVVLVDVVNVICRCEYLQQQPGNLVLSSGD